MAEQPVQIWYLEATSARELNPKPPVTGFEITEDTNNNGQLNRQLYQQVGADWQWTDKLAWSDDQWQSYAGDPTLRTWLLKEGDQMVGYFELQQRDQGDIEINYFGLLPDYYNRGLGGYLLTRAIEEAWGWDAERVIVNTCSLDHPGALANYLARGMAIYKTK